MYLRLAPIIVYCSSSQANNCDAVPMTGDFFGKISWWVTFDKYLPGHCDRVPTTGLFDKCASNCSLFQKPRNCHTLPTTGYFFWQTSWWVTLAKYLPGHCDRVPTTLVLDHSTYWMIVVHTRAIGLLVKCKRVVGTGINIDLTSEGTTSVYWWFPRMCHSYWP